MRTFSVWVGWLALLSTSWAQTAGPNARKPAAEPLPKTTYSVAMKDGVRLATDVYLPPGDGPFPVILARHPYDKNIPTFWAAAFVPRGFAFVIQDTRGRFASEGENLPFIGESAVPHSDGRATLEWIGRQPWCNGKIGTYGQSAVTIAQYLMLMDKTPLLAGQHLTVGTPSLYHGMIYPGGIFSKTAEDWLLRQKYDPRGLRIWRDHPAEDAYWKAWDARPHLARAPIPAVHIGGYYDLFARGTVEAFQAYRRGPRGREQKLILGPWTHGTFREATGYLTFPGAKEPPGKTHDPVAWYEELLMGKDHGIAASPAVRYYVMGDPLDPSAPGKTWRTANNWPPYRAAISWFLAPDGGLGPSRPAAGLREYAYDPRQPTPTAGGLHLLQSGGTQLQTALEGRNDLLHFTGPVLEAPLEITGDPRVELYVSSDAPDTDFFVRLVDVYPDGRAVNLCEGQLRARFRESFTRERLMVPGKVYRLEITLSPISILLNRGHRLRVQVASSNDPAYEPNPNTGRPAGEAGLARVALNRVHCGGGQASRVILPVPPAGAAR